MLRILAAIALLTSSLGLHAHAAPADPAQSPQSPQSPPAPQGAQPADPRVALLKLLPAGAKLEDLRPSPVPGIYEFMQGVDISYLTADGKYFFDGNIYDM